MDSEFSEEDKVIIKEMIEFYKVLKMNGALIRVATFMIAFAVWIWVSAFVYGAIYPIYGSFWAIVASLVVFAMGLYALIKGFLQGESAI